MLQTQARDDPTAVLAQYDVARALTALLIALLLSLVVGLPLLLGDSVIELLTRLLAFSQDVPLAPIFLCAALLRPKSSNGPVVDRPGKPKAVLVLSVIAVLLVGWIGHSVVFQGYDLSRDEQMAVFDQQIFSHGRLFWPIPSEWRTATDALNRRFIVPIGANEFWVSAYLPVHSAFRALLSSIGVADLASPIQAVLSTIGMWAAARRIWPESNRTVILSLLLLITSSQVLVTSMTTFSMTMHLALNLLWLALFLNDRWQSHLLAVILGFFATGIHQPVFHPLFAAPFLALLARDQRWRLLAFYVAAYTIIGMFWLAWPLWIASHGTGPPIAIHCAGGCSSGVGLLQKLHSVSRLDVQHVWLTAANVLRFICWQHPLLVPLAIFGTISCWRTDSLVKALALGFMLPIVIMALILPWQGHGWGYRYVHPVLGNAILLACYGFRRLETQGWSLRRPLIVTTPIAVLLVPLHAWMAANIAKPFVEIRRALAIMPADLVIIDTQAVPYGQDVVLNRFDLSNRPILLISSLLRPDDLPALCARYSISFYDGPKMAPLAQLFWMAPPKAPSVEQIILHERAAKVACRVIQDRFNSESK